jgi:hypothetical protein
MYKRILIILIFCVVAYGARAVDLNAPVVNTPTVGSEIKRGFNAAMGCNILLSGPEFGLCIADIGEKVEQQTTNSDPFTVGLYFHAWEMMDIAGYPDKPLTFDLAKARYADAQQEAAGLFKVWTHYEKQLGVTDDQIISAIGIKGDKLKDRIAFWTSRPAS